MFAAATVRDDTQHASTTRPSSTMDTIFRLREALTRVLSYSVEDEVPGDQELFEELMVQKPRLLSLLDVGQRNAQEQKEVESGV